MNQELLQLLNALKTAEGLSLGAIAKEVKDLKDDKENIKKDLENVLLQIVDKVDSIPLNEEIGKVNDKLRSEVAKLTESFDKKTEKQIKSIENKIKTLATELRIEIESKIPETIRETIVERINEVPKELSTKEKIDLIQEALSDKHAPMVVDMLESLEGDDRLDKKAIKGLEKVIGQEDLDRAIGILDSRTNFLINKINNLPQTSGPVGAVELATTAETNTGTDATRAVTPDGLAGSYAGTKNIGIQFTSGSSAITTGDGKAYIEVPPELNGMDIIGVSISTTAPSTSGTIDVQVARGRQSSATSAHTYSDVLSTKVTIDANEYSSKDAATPAVINTSNDDLATGDMLRVDLDSIGSGPTAVLTISIRARLP